MALSKEDKADVKGAMGKAMARKVAMATNDYSNGKIKKGVQYDRDVDSKDSDDMGERIEKKGIKDKALKAKLGKKTYAWTPKKQDTSGELKRYTFGSRN